MANITVTITSTSPGTPDWTEKLADTVKAETVPRVWDKIINLSQKPS
ncbi:hypothetical protein I541_5613 [Mycobacteroides abscessus]|nr:hypothetical protein [Mycobacteroides abscessus]EUA68404.1 hypothetical protein I541_5613 [Mycobacteroides abscessus]